MLFSIAAVAAVMLLVGYQTKWATFVSWLLLMSLHGRFPLITQGGDMLLRCMLFWSLFVPLDARWSVARAEGGRRKAEGREKQVGYVVSWGTAAVVVQLAVMYLFTAMLKTSPSWRTEFSAAYYALAIDHFTSELGYLLLQFPALLWTLTVSSILLEWIGPLLLFAPLRHTFFRIAVPLSFIGFHLGLATTMDLGTFPWICIVFWLALLPPVVWNAVERCVDRLMRASSSATEVRTTCRVHFIGSISTNCIAAFLLFYVVLLNINRLAHPLATVGRPPLSLLGKATGLDQYWNMFSPGPYRFGGWLRIEGITVDGRLVNLYQPDQPLPDTKPANVSSTYPTQYWRRCMVMMYEFEEVPHQQGVLRYLARQWNATHDVENQVIAARLVHMIEPTPPPFADKSPREPIERRKLREVMLSPTAAPALATAR
jgi:hypothetical protein